MDTNIEGLTMNFNVYHPNSTVLKILRILVITFGPIWTIQDNLLILNSAG